MPDIPFVLNLDSPDSMYYGHDMFPNRMYRRLHSRQHHDLDLHTLGLIARMGAHAHHLVANKRNGELAALGRGGHSNKQGNFEVHLDVGLFQPGELTVKLVNDCIVVEGKHEEREDDHGHVSRHFVRRYPLPKEFDSDAIASTLSEDGVLNITVPPLVSKEELKERIIPIKHVGPSDLFQNGNGHKEAAPAASASEPEAK
ncbi:heat shock protein 67B3 [Drosophila santomea]|uniref:heat shock protein 67B3 n=1 Tax=Drosophila santomea TaxID=129105 RepID=UPI001953CCD5|nr:heat shock protein 67B3 [Drosophila santomea]